MANVSSWTKPWLASLARCRLGNHLLSLVAWWQVYLHGANVSSWTKPDGQELLYMRPGNLMNGISPIRSAFRLARDAHLLTQHLTQHIAVHVELAQRNAVIWRTSNIEKKAVEAAPQEPICCLCCPAAIVMRCLCIWMAKQFHPSNACTTTTGRRQGSAYITANDTACTPQLLSASASRDCPCDHILLLRISHQ